MKKKKEIILILKEGNKLDKGKYVAIQWTKEWQNGDRKVIGQMVKEMQQTLSKKLDNKSF